MAKKKKSPKAPSREDSDSLATDNIEPEASGSVGEDAPEPESLPGPATAATTSMHTEAEDAAEDTRSQLAAALKEIQQLKQQLASRDDEISQLKQQQQVTVSNGKGRSEEMEKLQQKLASLKKEQAEADANRDAAWKQLKGVVAEITQLASTENFPKIPLTPMNGISL